MKSNSTVKPPTLHNLGNGYWYYNFNIIDGKIADESGKMQPSFFYDQVKITGTPTYEKCVRAVIRSLYDESKEFSLINKYNAFSLGISTNEADKAEYEAYLRAVIAIKNMVKKDLQV